MLVIRIFRVSANTYIVPGHYHMFYVNKRFEILLILINSSEAEVL